MSERRCTEPIAAETLLEYWLRELDDAGEARIEEHLFGCGTCTAALEDLAALGANIRACVASGGVRAVVTDMFVWWLLAGGVRVREYRVPRDGSVHCSIAPQDDVAIARLELPLAGVEKLDLVITGEDGSEEVLRDVPFNPQAGEVLVAPRIDPLRALPATTVRMRLVASEAGGPRTLGEYTFLHTPWSGA